MKQRIVVYLSPDAVRALDVLRSWAGARSRGAMVEALVDWAGREWGGEVTRWAIRRWQPHQEGGENEN